MLHFVREFKPLALSQIRCGVGDVMEISAERISQRALLGRDSRARHCEAHSRVTESDSQGSLVYDQFPLTKMIITCVTFFIQDEKSRQKLQ